jgi:hypothetical protein
MVHINYIIGNTLGKIKVLGMTLVQKFIKKDAKLPTKAHTSGLMIYKIYFEANVEDVNESVLDYSFCRNYNTIILIKF